MPRPLRVWLVENHDPFPPASSREGALVRSGIRARLHRWFTLVVRHRDAIQTMPAGYQAVAEVNWTNLANPAQIGDRDIVIYFSPSPFATSPPPTTPQTVHAGPYRAAASQLTDATLRTAILNAIGANTAGGHTIRASQGNQQVPVISEVFVLYDRQLSNLHSRVDGNVETLSVAAFHEAGHNKADDLHQLGGGGIFGATYTGQRLSAANIAFLAQNIWNWGPQYTSGQPLTPVTRP